MDMKLVKENLVNSKGHMTQRLKIVALSFLMAALFAGLLAQGAQAQSSERHGRKYKAPPPTSHVVVSVIKASNGKPIHNAAVIFHPIKGEKDEGNLEVKTDPEGKAIIDVLPVGSSVRLQVIASGYATYGEDYDVPDATKDIVIKMVKPQAQYSTYKDANGQPSNTKPGVQEPAVPKQTTPPAAATPPAASSNPSK